MGDDTVHGGSVGRIPPQGGPQDDSKATLEAEVREGVVSSLEEVI